MRILILLALLLAPALPAQAQSACGPHSSFSAQLADTYRETRRGGGLAGPTAFFEVWASSATGTWTILMVRPNGLACIMAQGDGWRDADDVPLERGDDA